MNEAHNENSSNNASPSPSLTAPSGSSKRKSKPVKRVLDAEIETPLEPEPRMQNSSDGSPTPNTIAEALENANGVEKEEESSTSVTPEMDQSEIMRRFGELLASSQLQTAPGMPPTAFQSLLAAATAGCPMDSAVPGVPAAPLMRSEASDGFLQAVLSSSLASLASNGQTPTTAMGNLPVSAFVGYTPATGTGERRRPPARSPAINSTLALSKGPVKRKLFDASRELGGGANATGMSKEERIDLDDLENFAQMFKKQRIKFGFTQGDVGVALGRRYGTDFSQTTISRFEALNLSFKNMCKLRPLLKEWLKDAESAIANGASLNDLLVKPAEAKKDDVATSLSFDSNSHLLSMTGETHVKRRRKRTNLDMAQRTALDAFFAVNPRPDHDRMTEIAHSLELERDVVRVWFCNRRQKLRRSDEPDFTDNPLLSSLKALSENGVALPLPVQASSSDTSTTVSS